MNLPGYDQWKTAVPEPEPWDEDPAERAELERDERWEHNVRCGRAAVNGMTLDEIRDALGAAFAVCLEAEEGNEEWWRECAFSELAFALQRVLEIGHAAEPTRIRWANALHLNELERRRRG